jgi:hypothetical protein
MAVRHRRRSGPAVGVPPEPWTIRGIGVMKKLGRRRRWRPEEEEGWWTRGRKRIEGMWCAITGVAHWGCDGLRCNPTLLNSVL